MADERNQDEMILLQLWLSQRDVEFIEAEAWRMGFRRGGRKGSPGEPVGSPSQLIRHWVEEKRKDLEPKRDQYSSKIVEDVT